MGFLQPNIERLERNRDIDGLLRALKYPNPFIQRKAALALGRSGDLRAVRPLVDQLRFDGEGASEALRTIGRPATQLLIESLNDFTTVPHARRLIIVILGQGSDVRAIEPIIRIARSDWQLQEAAIIAIRNLGPIGDFEVIGTLIRGLSSSFLDEVGRVILDTLVTIGPPAVQQLIVALNDDSQNIRLGAANALGRIGDARAVEPLTRSLNDPDIMVRGEAAEALGRIGDSRAVGPLLNRINEMDMGYDFNKFARALVNLGCMPGHDRLGARICLVFSRWDLCVEIGEPAVGPLIDQFIYDGDGEIGTNVSDTLIKIGDPALEPLIRALEDPRLNVRMGVAVTLGRIGDARAVAPLIKNLRDPDFPVRMKAAEALGRLGDPKGVQLLISALHDQQRPVRECAARSLIGLYKSGRASECDRAAILAERNTITRRHEDSYNIAPSDCRTLHEDEGIGLYFPL